MTAYTIENTIELKLSKSKVIKNLSFLRPQLPKFKRTLLITLFHSQQEIKTFILHFENPKKEFFTIQKNNQKLFQNLKYQLINQNLKLIKIEICKPKF